MTVASDRLKLATLYGLVDTRNKNNVRLSSERSSFIVQRLSRDRRALKVQRLTWDNATFIAMIDISQMSTCQEGIITSFHLASDTVTRINAVPDKQAL